MHNLSEKKNTETHSLDNAFYTTYFYTKKRYLCMGLHIYFIQHIKDNVRMFLQCGLLIANRLEELAPAYMEKFKKSLHIPQVIPQKNKKTSHLGPLRYH